MRIVVLVKYVPQVDSDLSFTSGFTVLRDAAAGTLNELDEHAVEGALALASGDNDEVIALTMAPTIGDLALRKTFQLGVSRGIRLTDDGLADSDIFGTANALAAAIRKLGEEKPVDLVIAGMASSDAGGAVVPAVIANELGWPNLSFATSVALSELPSEASNESTESNKALTITRHIDDATETLQAALPAMLSVTDSANTVRPPNFKLLKEARTKPIETWTIADLDIDPVTVGAAGARVKVVAAGKVPAKPEPPKIFDDDQGSGAQALVEFLRTHNLIETPQ